MTTSLTFWRYYVPSEDGLSGWVDAVLRSDGFFAVVSDYGNYAYRWSCTGERDFREFFVGCDGYYVRSKLDPSTEFDEVATAKALRELVIASRRAKRLDAEDARDAYDAVSSIENDRDFDRWLDDWAGYLDDYYDSYKTRPPYQIMAFVEKALPRLQEMIRAEIKAEKGVSGAV